MHFRKPFRDQPFQCGPETAQGLCQAARIDQTLRRSALSAERLHALGFRAEDTGNGPARRRLWCIV